MELKTYQQNVLTTLREFLTQARRIGHETAYKNLTSTPEMKARLGKLRGDYKVWECIADVPRVCLKVPTGGGKTILAAHAIKIAAESWMDVEYPMVLWFTPSDVIRKQTAAALQNPRHPYRKALNEQFHGKVRVYDIDDKFNITPQDIKNHVCIIVSTVQSFKQSNTEKYNVYRHNENLESHFATISVTDRMERGEDGQVKFSFANLLQAHRPLMVMDEAHNAVTGLSEEMQARLYPSAIIELTATPRLQNNTLYNVFAYELKQEAMIKLPVMLVEHSDWTKSVTQSVLKRAELEEQCKLEREYIRPILLLQAEAKKGDDAITCDKLKDYLMQELNIREEEIAIATGEQRELDGVDVFNPACAVRYVITVQALKEGWDCSFAYVLCSVSNLKSKTFIEQLLGRILRMPYAQFRQTPTLNKAYAYVRSGGFGEAAEELVACLKNSGFDDREAKEAVVQQKEDPTEDLSLFSQQCSVTISTESSSDDAAEVQTAIETLLQTSAIPSAIVVRQEENGAVRLAFTRRTTEADVEAVSEMLPPKTSEELRTKFQTFEAFFSAVSTTPTSPAREGKAFRVPQLMMYVQGEWELADTDTLFEFMDWHLSDWASPQLSAAEFNIVQDGNTFSVDIDGQQVRYRIATMDAYLPSIGDASIWTQEQMTSWLVRKVQQADVSHPDMMRWVSDAVHHLCVTRNLPMLGLIENRFRIMDKLLEHIRKGRERAKANCHKLLFQDSPDVYADADDEYGVIEFREDMYDDEPLYKGSYQFLKHYTGPDKVPAFDGKNDGMDGEEFRCAQILDSIPQVSFWVRNVAKKKDAFSLPLSRGRFYPDFVAMLQDGRILVVEYKGAHLASNADTAEKATVGALWARKSNNLFLMAEKSKDGMDVRQQIAKIIR